MYFKTIKLYAVPRLLIPKPEIYTISTLIEKINSKNQFNNETIVKVRKENERKYLGEEKILSSVLCDGEKVYCFSQKDLQKKKKSLQKTKEKKKEKKSKVGSEKKKSKTTDEEISNFNFGNREKKKEKNGKNESKRNKEKSKESNGSVNTEISKEFLSKFQINEGKSWREVQTIKKKKKKKTLSSTGKLNGDNLVIKQKTENQIKEDQANNKFEFLPNETEFDYEFDFDLVEEGESEEGLRLDLDNYEKEKQELEEKKKELEFLKKEYWKQQSSLLKEEKGEEEENEEANSNNNGEEDDFFSSDSNSNSNSNRDTNSDSTNEEISKTKKLKITQPLKKNEKKPFVNSVPKKYLCSKSKKILTDPVKTPCGCVLEKKIIELEIKRFGCCPIHDNVKLKIDDLKAEVELKKEIQRWKNKNEKNTTENRKLENRGKEEDQEEEEEKIKISVLIRDDLLEKWNRSKLMIAGNKISIRILNKGKIEAQLDEISILIDKTNDKILRIKNRNSKFEIKFKTTESCNNFKKLVQKKSKTRLVNKKNNKRDNKKINKEKKRKEKEKKERKDKIASKSKGENQNKSKSKAKSNGESENKSKGKGKGKGNGNGKGESENKGKGKGKGKDKDKGKDKGKSKSKNSNSIPDQYKNKNIDQNNMKKKNDNHNKFPIKLFNKEKNKSTKTTLSISSGLLAIKNKYGKSMKIPLNTSNFVYKNKRLSITLGNRSYRVYFEKDHDEKNFFKLYNKEKREITKGKESQKVKKIKVTKETKNKTELKESNKSKSKNYKVNILNKNGEILGNCEIKMNKTKIKFVDHEKKSISQLIANTEFHDGSGGIGRLYFVDSNKSYFVRFHNPKKRHEFSKIFIKRYSFKTTKTKKATNIQKRINNNYYNNEKKNKMKIKNFKIWEINQYKEKIRKGEIIFKNEEMVEINFYSDKRDTKLITKLYHQINRKNATLSKIKFQNTFIYVQFESNEKRTIFSNLYKEKIIQYGNKKSSHKIPFCKINTYLVTKFGEHLCDGSIIINQKNVIQINREEQKPIKTTVKRVHMNVGLISKSIITLFLKDTRGKMYIQLKRINDLNLLKSRIRVNSQTLIPNLNGQVLISNVEKIEKNSDTQFFFNNFKIIIKNKKIKDTQFFFKIKKVKVSHLLKLKINQHMKCKKDRSNPKIVKLILSAKKFLIIKFKNEKDVNYLVDIIQYLLSKFD
ncbi:hypothetical protein M0813_09934 [Anaeramoeba flamelloides]|uniref:U-box domain-containing protein n=1 Tax=Anaeramoeba flamelloides TaxID=1746091 RepID=A0ABQ8X3X6_9EUKA|nr:hypothetical protein M0813_09934 [Anaeramoeba flamelloides]